MKTHKVFISQTHFTVAAAAIRPILQKPTVDKMWKVLFVLSKLLFGGYLQTKHKFGETQRNAKVLQLINKIKQYSRLLNVGQ